MATPLEALIVDYTQGLPKVAANAMRAAMEAAYDLGRESGLDAAAGAI